MARTVMTATAMSHPDYDARKAAETMEELWTDLRLTVPYWEISRTTDTGDNAARDALIAQYRAMFGSGEEDK